MIKIPSNESPLLNANYEKSNTKQDKIHQKKHMNSWDFANHLLYAISIKIEA
nr:MAG TPA: hypothetical protein [Caudoviricetes sp.]